MKRIILLILVVLQWIALPAKDRVTTIKVVHTTDVHGAYYPYNFITNEPWQAGLACVHRYVEEQRKLYGNRLLLMDSGDVLQGQPSAYYYNYVDTVSPHWAAEAMNYMRYDVGTVGNHDIETGHAVYDRWIKQCHFPMLGANVIRVADGKPYLKPYTIIERNKVRIAVLGLITPAIPAWLPENLWSGLRFEDMEQTARKWMPILKKKERADVIIGLFHSGVETSILANKWKESASLEVAVNVPGFDLVLCGHDHRLNAARGMNMSGNRFTILDPANDGRYVGEAEIRVVKRGRRVISKNIQGRYVAMGEPSAKYVEHFTAQSDSIKRFVSEKIGRFERTIQSKPAFFGSSAFVDLIHRLQLQITGAEISLAAPLSVDAEIRKGDIYVRDMFKLYKYENMLYTMRLRGSEVKGALEESYNKWANRMTSPSDHLLLVAPKERGLAMSGERGKFIYPSFNFESAAGIQYEVDVTKPEGERVNIKCMADGTPFDPNRFYRVAVNSYRGNGGGELLTKGGGISQEELKNRILFSTSKDLRFYLMKYINRQKVLNPQPLNQWRFVPEEWTKPAAERDFIYLFGE